MSGDDLKTGPEGRLSEGPLKELSGEAAGQETLHLTLEGFEGPLELLLELARAQKVDLARISILQLAEQYIAVLEKARSLRLELAADWLVMAAWLAWLKSRLLLPETGQGDNAAEEAVGQLHERLFELERIRRLVFWLEERPLLGRHVFERKEAENHIIIDNTALRADLASLVSAYLAARRRSGRKQVYQPVVQGYWSVQEARTAMMRLLRVDHIAAWQNLQSVLPPALLGEGGTAYRAAFAGALMAGLEMAKGGSLELRQNKAFGAIEWRSRT